MDVVSIGKREFNILGSGRTPVKITGYIYKTARNFYGIDKRGGEWLITDIMTGLLVGSGKTRAAALDSITADLDELLTRTHSREDARVIMGIIAKANDISFEKPETAPAKQEKTRRAIKTRTYNNFMRVLRAVMAKGYDRETAETITRRIFDQYEANPRGLSVWGLFDLVADETTAGSPAEDSQTDETTADGETVTDTETKPQEGAEDSQTTEGRETETAPTRTPETAPQRREKATPAGTNTDSKKAPPRGGEKPARVRGRRLRDRPRSPARVSRFSRNSWGRGHPVSAYPLGGFKFKEVSPPGG